MSVSEIRATAVDDVEGWLVGEILEGRWSPGTLLPPERELAARHGVTRASLRQALARLERYGLIQTRQGSGSRVRALEEGAAADLLPIVTSERGGEWLAEVFEVRRYVGALIARRAARRRQPADVARLTGLVLEIEAAPDAAAAQQTEAEFHRALARASGNRVFVLLVNTLLRAYRPLHPRLRGAFADPAATAAALQPLVDGVARGRPAVAERAAMRYLQKTERVMLLALLPAPEKMR